MVNAAAAAAAAAAEVAVPPPGKPRSKHVLQGERTMVGIDHAASRIQAMVRGKAIRRLSQPNTSQKWLLHPAGFQVRNGDRAREGDG